MTELTTLANVRAYLGLEPSDTASDDLLETLIAGASASVVNMVGRDLVLKAHTVLLDGTGKTALMTPDWPIRSVQSLKVNGVTISPAASIMAPGYRFDDTMLIINGGTFARGLRNVEISYTAGYDPIPDDVSTVCTKIVAGKFKERDWVGFRSKTLAGETVTFDDVEVSEAVRNTLSNYKRVWA